jgi:hypothetical protein
MRDIIYLILLVITIFATNISAKKIQCVLKSFCENDMYEDYRIALCELSLEKYSIDVTCEYENNTIQCIIPDSYNNLNNYTPVCNTYIDVFYEIFNVYSLKALLYDNIIYTYISNILNFMLAVIYNFPKWCTLFIIDILMFLNKLLFLNNIITIISNILEFSLEITFYCLMFLKYTKFKVFIGSIVFRILFILFIWIYLMYIYILLYCSYIFLNGIYICAKFVNDCYNGYNYGRALFNLEVNCEYPPISIDLIIPSPIREFAEFTKNTLRSFMQR